MVIVVQDCKCNTKELTLNNSTNGKFVLLQQKILKLHGFICDLKTKCNFSIDQIKAFWTEKKLKKTPN